MQIAPPAGSAAANGYATQMVLWQAIVGIRQVRSQRMVMTKGSYAGDCPLDKTQDGYNEEQDGG